MDIKYIRRALKDHSVDYKIIYDRIVAKEVYSRVKGKTIVHGMDLVDVTDYTVGELKQWLGY